MTPDPVEPLRIARKRGNRSRLLLTGLGLVAALLLASDLQAKQRLPRGGLPGPFGLQTVQVKGKPYYVTYRVGSEAERSSFTNKADQRRWQGRGHVWQYGEGFYVFNRLADAQKFVRCGLDLGAETLANSPRSEVQLRTTIMQVLLPKERFDSLAANKVQPELDWAVDRRHPRFADRNQLVARSEVLFGRWQEDPQHPAAAFIPMVGAAQIAIKDRGPSSILNEAIVRVLPPSAVGRLAGPSRPRAPRVANQSENRSRSASFGLQPGLTKEQRISATLQRAQSQHAEINHLFGAQALQGRRLISYLGKHFSEEAGVLRKGYKTWEGAAIRRSTELAFDVLGNQLKYEDLSRIRQTNPSINVDRTLQLALALRNLGKPPAIERARNVLELREANGGGGGSAAAPVGATPRRVRAANELAVPRLSRVMWKIGCPPAEIRLARALVGNNVLDRLAAGKMNFTSAASELQGLASKAGVNPRDFFVLQRLLYTADAGAHPQMRQQRFSTGRNGKLEPTDFAFQQLALRFGSD